MAFDVLPAAIKQRARDLGFDLVGIAPASPSGYRQYFEQWIGEGKAGEMQYLAGHFDERTDPATYLPSAASVICVGMNYFVPLDPAPPGHARIARYALGDDYHEVIKSRLFKLADWIRQSAPEAQTRCSVDTAPVMEKELAARAGIGWIGRNTCVINEKIGSWVLLGEVITTLPLAPDDAATDRCGSCRRCIDACPTAAITAPFQLDARRCISYLTIELKGPIPEEFRAAIGTRIYGCDDCLAACPWNRFAKDGALMRPHYRAELAAPDLIELLSLDEAGFKKRFAGTPILRAKRRGFLRNVCVALGNCGDTSALPALTEAAADAEPLIAEHAQWAIRRVRERLKAED
jgi:epoxyqueuosine reductase